MQLQRSRKNRIIQTRLDNLAWFVLMPSQRHDIMGVAALIAGVRFGALLTDKAFDANWLLEALVLRDAHVVVSQMPAGADVQVATSD